MRYLARWICNWNWNWNTVMNITLRQSRFRTIKDSDPGFIMHDGVVMARRAGFEISQGCPREYKLIIADCIDRGWLKPVATVYDYEQTFDLLKEN